MKILVPDTCPVELDPSLEAVAVTYDVTAAVPEQHRDAEVLVVWGNPADRLVESARDLTQVRLVQGLLAGAESLLAAGWEDQVAVCSGVGLHDATVTEHTFALLLALVRRLPASADAQAEHRWARELGGMQPLHPDGPITTLLGARVVVWGFGSIGQTLAPRLRDLGADVVGVARTAGERGGFPVVATEDVASVLSDADVLISVLPAGDVTDRIMDDSVFSALPDHAYFINVGRGSTVDESALIRALESGAIAGAAIDVAAREPLPAYDPLWSAPGLIITPHAAGGRPVNAGELVSANVDALARGADLRNRIR